MPTVLTRLFTGRVGMPCTQASRITAAGAFAAIRRGSGKPGRRRPLRSLGMRGSPIAGRVPRSRSRYPLRCRRRAGSFSPQAAPVTAPTSCSLGGPDAKPIGSRTRTASGAASGAVPTGSRKFHHAGGQRRQRRSRLASATRPCRNSAHDHFSQSPHHMTGQHRAHPGTAELAPRHLPGNAGAEHEDDAGRGPEIIASRAAALGPGPLPWQKRRKRRPQIIACKRIAHLSSAHERRSCWGIQAGTGSGSGSEGPGKPSAPTGANPGAGRGVGPAEGDC